MDSQHEGRCNCKSDNTRLPTPQFPLIDQLSFNPATQDPSSSSAAPFPATPTGPDEVLELTQEVFNQDLIMLSYFSGTRHLSHGLLEWMKLYARLQSWNLGNDDALKPEDLTIVENPGLIPILPTLRMKPQLERDGLASQSESMKQPLQRHNYRRVEASTAPLLLSDCNNPPAKLQCVSKTEATFAITDIAATTTKANYPALVPPSTSLVPLKQMALCSIMSLANTENSAQKVAGIGPESETAFTAGQKPAPATKRTLVPVWSQRVEHTPLNEKWIPSTKEQIENDADMSIHRQRAMKPIIAEPDPIAEPNPVPEMKPEPTIKPVPILESVHGLKVTPVTVSESRQKLEIAPINNNSNLPKEEATTLSRTEVLYKPHAQNPNNIEPVFSAESITESTNKCASVFQSAEKLKPASIDTKWKPSKKKMNEIEEFSVADFINRLHTFKPVTAKPATDAKTKPEPSIECPSVSESAFKIETTSIDTIYKLLKKKLKKAIKKEKAAKRHSDSMRRHDAVFLPEEDQITALEYLYKLITQMSANKSETKLELGAYVSENTFQLNPKPIDIKQKHWNEEEIIKTEKISTSEFINCLSAQTPATENDDTKTKTTPEFTTHDAPVSENALIIEPAPIDTEGKPSKAEMNKVINTQNGEAPPSVEKRRPRVSSRKRKKDKILESEFIYRHIAHMTPTIPETKPESTTKCTQVSENMFQLNPTPIYTKQKHWNEEEINEMDKISTSECINCLSAQTSATEKHASKTKTTPEYATEGAPVFKGALKEEPATIDKKRKLPKEEMNTVINTQNGEAPPAVEKRRPHVCARKRKKDKITESEFICRLIAHISATKPEHTTKCAYVSENTLHLDPTPVDMIQKHWNEEEINKTEKISESKFIYGLSAQTSATEKPATKTKTTPECTTKGAQVSESALKEEPAPIDKKRKLPKEDMNTVINIQNGEAPPSVEKRQPHVSARKRKKDKITESEFICRLIADMSATKPEHTTKCAYVSENTLHLDPTPVDMIKKHWNEEQINKTDKISESKFIYGLSAQTSATEKPATKTNTTPKCTTEDAQVSESALKEEPAPIDKKRKLPKEDMNTVINIQNGEAPPSVEKRQPHVSARKRKKDKITESEFICRLIAHMSATKPEHATKCAYVSENTLHLDPTPVDMIQKHWNEEEINKTEKISKSKFIYGLSAQTSATEKPATKTKTTPECTTEGAQVSESALKIEPAPIDTNGNLSKEEMIKVVNTQNGEAPPSVAKGRPREDKITESEEFVYRLIAHIISKAKTEPEPTTENNVVLQDAQTLQATLPYENTKLLKEEAISETVVMSTSGSCNGIRANMPPATETKFESEKERAPVLESMQNVQPSLVERTLMPEIPAVPAWLLPACDTYSTHFDKVRLTYYDYFNFLEHEFDKKTQTDNDEG